MREIKPAFQEDAHRWLVEAEKDVKDAEMLLRHEGYYPLCRLACLAAEKAMRALLLGRGQESSKQSGLAALSLQVAAAEPALGSLTRSLRPLEPFAIIDQAADPQATSPPPPLYSREAAKQAIALARQAVIEVKRTLTGSP